MRCVWCLAMFVCMYAYVLSMFAFSHVLCGFAVVAIIVIDVFCWYWWDIWIGAAAHCVVVEGVLMSV